MCSKVEDDCIVIEFGLNEIREKEQSVIDAYEEHIQWLKESIKQMLNIANATK